MNRDGNEKEKEEKTEAERREGIKITDELLEKLDKTSRVKELSSKIKDTQSTDKAFNKIDEMNITETEKESLKQDFLNKEKKR